MEDRERGKRLEALSWGLLFVWLGVYLFLDLKRDGVLAIGIGCILLLENLLRRHFGMRVSRFWVISGLLFLALGVFDFFQVGLLPVLLIGFGLFIIFRFAARNP